MRKNKHPLVRLQQINDILQTRSSAQLVVKAEALAVEKGISLRQLRTDMDVLRGKGAPLEYVGGFSHDPAEQFVRVFPLERIEGEPRNLGYCHDKPRDFDAETYWRHIYGISVPKDGKIEPIVLEFSPPQDRYFLSTPFFEPFEVLSQTPKRLVIQFSLMVNVDLVNKLASLGAGVRVLAPAHLAASLQGFFQRALRRYDD